MCSHWELHTSRSKDIPWTADRGCHRAFSSPLNKDVLIRCRNIPKPCPPNAQDMPNYGRGNVTPLTPPSFYLNKHRTLVGLTKATFTVNLMCGVWGFQCLVQYGNLRRIQEMMLNGNRPPGNDGWMILPKTLVSRNWTTRECCLLIRYLTVLNITIL